jgi:hypothetical protein
MWVNGCTGFFIIVTWLGGVETRYREVEVGLVDESDVCAGVEGLVVRCIPISTINDLKSCVVTRRDLGWCVRKYNAAVAWIEICNAILLDQRVEVIVRGRIFTGMSISNNINLKGVDCLPFE